MLEKIILKSVYIPIIGIIIGLILNGTKYADMILNEKHAIIYCMISHILIGCGILFILFIF